MSIKVYIYFRQALTNVVITDLRSGDKTKLNNVAATHQELFEPDDFDGEAKVRVASTEYPQGEGTLSNGEMYIYPPNSRSTLDEVAQLNGLGDLAREIDKLIKNKPSAAKPSRVTKSSPSADQKPV
jgi:hypothetical protein